MLVNSSVMSRTARRLALSMIGLSSHPGRPMAPRGTVTTSSPSAGQTGAGRNSNKNGNGKKQNQGIPRTVVSRMVDGKPLEARESEVIQALMSSGSAMSQKEIRFCYTDFFDTSNDVAAPYFCHTFSTVGSLIAGDSNNPSRRIIGADLWAMPKFDLDTSKGAFLFLSTVPSNPGGNDSAPGIASNVQNTLLLPKADSRWVKVGSWRSKTLFADSTVAPAVNSQGDQAIFSGVVLDPDTLSAAGVPLQCKVDIYFAESVPSTADLKYLQSNYTSASILYSVPTAATVSRAVILSVTGTGDSV